MEDRKQFLDRRLAFSWLAMVVGLILLSPLGSFLAERIWGCPFKSLTGFACPLCGITRAALLLARFDVVGAFSSYPLPTLAWILFMAGGLVAGWLAWRRRPLPHWRLPAWGKVGILGAVLLNWAYSIATGV